MRTLIWLRIADKTHAPIAGLGECASRHEERKQGKSELFHVANLIAPQDMYSFPKDFRFLGVPLRAFGSGYTLIVLACASLWAIRCYPSRDSSLQLISSGETAFSAC